MRYRYTLRSASGKTAQLVADPNDRGVLERLCAAIAALRSTPGEEVSLRSEPAGPVHIAAPLACVFADIAKAEGGAE